MVSSDSDAARPSRGWRRTEERRAQLAEIAVQQFHRHGFHQVSMAGVAAAVELTAPAIYRHFRNKEDLLAAAIGSALDAVDEALAGVEDAALHEFLQAAAGVAVARREVWILLQREMRHLGVEQRAPLEDRFASIVRRFTTAIQAERADLGTSEVQFLTTAALAVLASPSVYRRRLPEDEQRAILAAASEATCRATWVSPTGPAQPDRPFGGQRVIEPAPGRSEEVLGTAIRLFAKKGYQAVSLDEIAAELGMAGPSLYYYFATKADLLVAAFVRATEWLAAQRTRAPQPPSLDDLITTYIDLGIRERLLFGVYVWEAVNLPPEAGRRIRAGLDADIDAWCAALGRLRPELTAPQCLVLVHAGRAVVHDIVRLGHWHDRPDIAEVLRTLVHAALAAPLER
ncbi:helix-turn-helix domain-containing protein [Dactylosporangium sp. AC04546]|uniref:TetR/AcrR family transcriptional regulator n=1 Tax=Dactylosporangium sp. AC04546 TaxID=2862460 RepID=UPI001EE083F4|nr:TetR/AcrR family transcriptional regulator [Dactylosporangium sp. AC04546]WVK86859.1 helix-turn-helix domain-containing protein [Dactylosporangium sp. AC04546]